MSKVMLYKRYYFEKYAIYFIFLVFIYFSFFKWQGSLFKVIKLLCEIHLISQIFPMQLYS